jgi:hypothetical protein
MEEHWKRTAGTAQCVGRSTGVLGACSDITARKQLGEALVATPRYFAD